MKNKSTDDIQLYFNFNYESSSTLEAPNKNNNVISISNVKSNRYRNEKFKKIEKIVSLSNHLYK